MRNYTAINAMDNQRAALCNAHGNQHTFFTTSSIQNYLLRRHHIKSTPDLVFR
jgi:hypothetical protein